MQKEWRVDMLTWRGQVSSEVQDVQPLKDEPTIHIFSFSLFMYLPISSLS